MNHKSKYNFINCVCLGVHVILRINEALYLILRIRTSYSNPHIDSAIYDNGKSFNSASVHFYTIPSNLPTTSSPSAKTAARGTSSRTSATGRRTHHIGFSAGHGVGKRFGKLIHAKTAT